jgi:secretion/DNA translocation related TadE-like protein
MTVVLVAEVGVVVMILIVGLALTSAVSAAHRARAGADLGALAAAVELSHGATPAQACARAALIANRNSARVSSCGVSIDGSVSLAVSASIGWTPPGGGPLTTSRRATARARAGPSP